MTAGLAGAGLRGSQAQYWNGEAGLSWINLQDRIDSAFSDLTRVLLDFAAPAGGEQVVDVGCGCGRTVLDLCWRVGPRGRVLGLDISRGMVERARLMLMEAGFAQGSVALADATIHPFDAGSADLVFSRFGVMFFPDPVRAFANLRRSLRHEGRLACAVWRPLQENAWFSVPLQAAHLLSPPVSPPVPGEPGPFSMADPNRIHSLLAGAGWRDIRIAPQDIPITMAGPGEAASAARLATQIGPLARALHGAPEKLRGQTEAIVAEALSEYDTAKGVRLTGAVWLVSARA
jgi:SAM-dependent methyltransferase